MWRAIGRLIVVPLGFLIAAAVAGFVVVTLGLETLTHSLHGQDGEQVFYATFDLAWQAMLLISVATLVPALLVVIIGEVARIRSWLYYVIGGGLSLAVLPLYAMADPSSPATLPAQQAVLVLATAGFAGGLAYWLIAGRNA